jgi:predicted nucleic acid-binding protein
VILVDSSVWIAHLRGHQTPATAKLEAAANREPLLAGDLILLEMLQGARDEAHAARIECGLRQYALVQLLDVDLAPRAGPELSQIERTRRHGPKDRRHYHRHFLHRTWPRIAAR